MLAKKYSVGLMLSFLMCTMQAMELVVVPNLKKFDEESYLRVALYLKTTENRLHSEEKKDAEEIEKRKQFLEDKNNPHAQAVQKYMPSIQQDVDNVIKFIATLVADIEEDKLLKVSALHTELDKCSLEHRQVIAFVAKRNIVSAIIFSEDVFDCLCNRALPEFYEDHSGFFRPEFRKKNNKEEEIDAYDMFKSRQKKEIIDNKISRKDMTELIKDMPPLKALSAFRFVSQKCVAVDSKARFDSRVENECVKGTIYTPKNEYYFTFEELSHLSQELEGMLRSIVQKSNEGVGRWKIDKRFKFTDDNIALLKLEKEFLPCLKNDVFTKAQITTDLATPTKFERIMDTILFGVPLLVVVLAPSWVACQTTGLLQGAGGCAATAIGCFIIGQGITPQLDSYNSGYRQLTQCFGEKNCKPITKGWQFALLGSMNHTAAILAETLWGCNSAILRNIGGAVHGIRSLVSLYVMSMMENYGNPFKRSNAKGVPFTFGDLLSGPKFNSSNTK